MFIIIKYILQSFFKTYFNIYRLFNCCLFINCDGYNLINMIQIYEISSEDLECPWNSFEDNKQNNKNKRSLDCNDLIKNTIETKKIKNNELNKVNNKEDIINQISSESQIDINSKNIFSSLNNNKIINNEFYPHTIEENLIISEKMVLNIPYNIYYLKQNNNEIFFDKKSIFNPIIIIFKITREESKYSLYGYLHISYFISNIPNYLNFEFKNKNIQKIYTDKQKRISCILYNISINIKISMKTEIKLKDLLPNLLFINKENFFRIEYIEKILKWNYKTINIEKDIKLFLNKLNINPEKKIGIEKDYFNNTFNVYSIGFFFNQNNLFNELKELNGNKCPVLLRIITKLTNFKYKLMYCFQLNFSIINLKILNEIFLNLRKEFILDGYEKVCINNYEINHKIIILIYRKIFNNFYKLSESIIDSYNIFLRDTNEHIVLYK